MCTSAEKLTISAGVPRTELHQLNSFEDRHTKANRTLYPDGQSGSSFMRLQSSIDIRLHDQHPQALLPKETPKNADRVHGPIATAIVHGLSPPCPKSNNPHPSDARMAIHASLTRLPLSPSAHRIALLTSYRPHPAKHRRFDTIRFHLHWWRRTGSNR